MHKFHLLPRHKLPYEELYYDEEWGNNRRVKSASINKHE